MRAPTSAVAWAAASAVVTTCIVAGAHPADFSAFYAEASGRDLRVTFDLHPNALREALAGLDVDGDGKLAADEVARGSSEIVRLLDEGVRVASAGAPCVATATLPARLFAGVRVQVERVYTCDRAPDELTWTVRALTAIEGGHSFLGRTRLGAVYDQFVFKPGAETHSVAVAPTVPGSAADPRAEPARRPSGLGSFFSLGVRHILTGIDHLAFVLALVFAARRLRDLALVVTSFTLAHSVTLALGVFDLVHAPVRLVESLIAASIAWVALENVVRREPRHRAAVTFGFGLLHGLGFSAALRDIGWPPGGVAPALFAFNAGVEAGQLAVVVPAFLVVSLWLRGRASERAVVRGVSAALACAGVYWLVVRALGFTA